MRKEGRQRVMTGWQKKEGNNREDKNMKTTTSNIDKQKTKKEIPRRRVMIKEQTGIAGKRERSMRNLHGNRAGGKAKTG